MVDHPRGSNQRVHGEQPSVGSKPWWVKTSGSANRTADIPHPGWETTKRVFDWESVTPPLREKEDEPKQPDEGSEEEPPCRVLQEEKSTGVAPCSSIPTVQEKGVLPRAAETNGETRE